MFLSIKNIVNILVIHKTWIASNKCSRPSQWLGPIYFCSPMCEMKTIRSDASITFPAKRCLTSDSEFWPIYLLCPCDEILKVSQWSVCICCSHSQRWVLEGEACSRKWKVLFSFFLLLLARPPDTEWASISKRSTLQTIFIQRCSSKMSSIGVLVEHIEPRHQLSYFTKTSNYRLFIDGLHTTQSGHKVTSAWAWAWALLTQLLHVKLHLQ
jgi:hypothetical protein